MFPFYDVIVVGAGGFQKGLPTFEYSPKKIKQSVTGNGNANDRTNVL